MQWYEYTTEMMKLWSQTQQEVLASWTQLTQDATMPPGPAQGFTSMSDLWRQTIQQSIRIMTERSGIDPTARDVAQKIFASQMNTMQLLETAMKTWQEMLPAIESGSDWRSILNRQMDIVRHELQRLLSGGLHTMGNMQQMWEMYLEEAQTVGKPWLDALPKSIRSYERFLSGDSSALIEMTSLYRDAFQESFGSLLEMPGLGYTREIDTKVRRSFAAWLEMQQAAYEYQVIIVETWMTAFERLMEELAKLGQTADNLDSVRDFLNRWSAIADETFKTAFHSPQYITLQSQYVNAMMEYRRQQRQMNETFMEFYDLPTRTEIDEAHRRIYELRKEIRGIKRELADLKANQAAPPKPTRAASSTQKRSTRKTAKPTSE